MSYVLGIDVSTTATKSIVVDEAGLVVATGIAEYGFDTPQPLWSEQHPGKWWEAAQHAIRQSLAGIDASRVVAVGLTGQMHGLVILDEEGAPVRPAILWNDQRTQAECEEMRQRVGKRRLIQISGNDALTGFTAPKLLWVRNHEPETYAKIRHVLLPKDFLRLQLTGDYAVDRAGGSGTILFDLAKRSWSPELLDELELPRDWFPPTFEGHEVTGKVTQEAAAATGIPAGTPLVGGGGDQAAAAIGTGTIEPGSLSISLGTSGVVFAATDAPDHEPDGRVHAFCHAVPDRWHLMGVMLSAAGSFQWFRDQLAAAVSFRELDEAASATPAGSDGLIFLPYLSGERTPHPDPHARGAFVGLTVRHNRGHLARAVMEGVAFGLRDGLELMVEAGVRSPSRARLTGGGSKSEVWRQILADVLELEIETLTTGEGAAYGAAILAAVGAEWGSAFDLASGWITAEHVTSPQSHERIYRSRYQVYRDLYPALKPSFQELREDRAPG